MALQIFPRCAGLCLFLVALGLLACGSDPVRGHGYAYNPLSRPAYCYTIDKYWSGDGGNSIKDPMCQAAFKYVLSAGGGDAPAASMFDQKNEYNGVLGAGTHQYNLTEHKELISGDLVCSAGHYKFRGTSLAGSWHHPLIRGPSRAPERGFVAMDIDYCPTAPHHDSYFEFFITKAGFDHVTSQITWNDLEFFDIQPGQATTLLNRPTLKQPLNQATLHTEVGRDCPNSYVYRFHLHVPYRSSEYTIVILWQRLDSPEYFCDCVDVSS